MKQAICIQCHNQPEQINLLVGMFPREKFDFYLHVDKKADILDKIKKAKNVFFSDRVNVEWGCFSQVTASMKMFEMLEGKKYRYIHLISGADFILKDPKYIYNFFKDNDNEYIQSIKLPVLDSWTWGGQDRFMVYYPTWIIRRPNKLFRKIVRVVYRELVMRTGFLKRRRYPVEEFYGGSQWFSVTGECLAWMMKYVREHPEYIEFFRNSLCSDEMFFQTLIRLSPYAAKVANCTLRYMEWKDSSGGPKAFNENDLVELDKVDAVFVRKITSFNVAVALRNRLVGGVKTALLVYPNLNHFSRFIGRGFSEIPVQAQGFYRCNSDAKANCIRMWSTLKLPFQKQLFYGKWTETKNCELVILFDAVASAGAMETLKLNNPNARCILYLWNINVNLKKVTYAKENGWEIWSFDEKECSENGWNHNGQFYPKVTADINFEQIDFFFCGYNKGRLPIIKEIDNMIKMNGFSSKIIVREWSRFGVPNKFLKPEDKKYITFSETHYEDIIDFIRKSRCIIDIVVEGQEGLTLRVMEALAFQKKLITNNAAIKKMGFYNPANIFIFGEDETNNLKNFMDMPYCTVAPDFISEFSIDKWWQRFMALEE